jgi:hypothetical protein
MATIDALERYDDAFLLEDRQVIGIKQRITEGCSSTGFRHAECC